MKSFLLSLLSILSFAQNSAIKIEIDSITSSDSIPTERKFTINYHIENLTDNDISFFLNPTVLTPNSRASMSKNVIYNLYQYDEKLDMDGVFTNRRRIDFDNKVQSVKSDAERDKLYKEFFMSDLNMNLDSIVKGDKSEKEINDYFLKGNSKELLKSIMTIASKKTSHYKIEVIWNKKRYHKIDNIEFYLNEDIPHYIDFTLNLMREEFKDKLTPDDYQQIITNPNFIKGWYTSNRVEINFKE